VLRRVTVRGYAALVCKPAIRSHSTSYSQRKQDISIGQGAVAVLCTIALGKVTVGLGQTALGVVAWASLYDVLFVIHQ